MSYFLADILSSFPVVEIPEDRDAPGLRCPLSVDETFVVFVQAVSFIALRDVVQATLGLEGVQS